MVGSEDRSLPRSLAASARLHERVRAFAARWENPPLFSDPGDETFESLALDIARYQAEASPGFARLVERAGSSLDNVASIPAVPTDVFRLTRVAAHPASHDAAVFETSGTTAAESGRHPVRDLTTYRDLALRLGRHTLFSRLPTRSLVVALAPPPSDPPKSSLGLMMQLFVEEFDGRAVTSDPQGVRFDARSNERFLIGSDGIDVNGLVRACKIARRRSEPLVVLATSFALVGLLDALDGETLPTPDRVVVMLTGGFKGRTREIAPERLRRDVARAFGTSESSLLGEYGMTELTSQLYEAWPSSASTASTARESVRPALASQRASDARPLWPDGGRPGFYHAPPWLRVLAVDPVSGEEVAAGSEGLARFIDLGNVDSAVAVQTQDRIRVDERGIELLGRATGAIARGCSLPFEGLISGAGR